ncbi:P-loop containing nucleoside triphosphate hydrolase [Plasmopara halstedii]|uniref:p-loop containing nucleoside triphosphate hydrolase n=1 Tax=Plasmopara halstedii TaxID=4781 RepID=A0A0P1A9W5_PLAHL|nr:P-loop containing nucleoside triphosphate hydrolase [Plasmopara halstedii]CEG36888.1 P-loop containing nucleoside triphosphate hydrolase [Plasmopara halstedii]|eukprot:XP_024573257.1 P-loop containing nucleoside triphosphate hydrolase [Plasmopara halstedii]
MDVVETETDGSDPMELLHVKRQGQFESFTRHRLQETLMLMGCRPKDAVIVTKEVFVVFQKHLSRECNSKNDYHDEDTKDPRFSMALPWHLLHQCIYSSLARLDYVKPHHLLDFEVAKEITQRNQSFAVLLGGTSGTGKSTLASLLAARLRLTTVLPTDSVRHVLRSFTSKDENPCAFVSTYQAGDALSKEMIAAIHGDREDMSAARLHKKMVLKGYKLQSNLVLEKLDRILTMFEERKQSLVVEGVHLNTVDLLALVKKHPTCVPFVIYISNENKHRERFAVRARHMTIDPQENKYIKHFDNIRIIQRHLCKHADRYLIPKIDNTNVDRSIATIQSTLVRVLRKLDRGEQLVDAKIGKFVTLSREHENSTKKGWSSKGVRKAMRPLLKQKVSKRLLLRRLLAEQTTDRFGARDPHQGEDSSSSEEEEDDASREADDERNVDEDDEDETTIVGSLLSGTNPHDYSSTACHVSSSSTQGQATPTRVAIQKQTLLDEIEEHSAGTSDNAELMRSLSQAVRQAAVWRASQPLTHYTDWESHVPPRNPEVTFSDVMENIPAFAAVVERGKRFSWNSEERRKSWMAGDQLADTSKQVTSSTTPPVNASRQFKAFLESQRVEGEAQLQMQRTQQQLQQQQVLPMHHQLPPIGRRTKALARRVQSLPVVPHQDSSSSLDFDFDSVSMTDANEDGDRVSQISSPRDGCVSPLEHSYDDTDSHFDVSSQSSVE